MAAAGFRGAVSLAAALAVPHTLTSGEEFPGRDLIIFVTAGVIAVTLLVQAPLLPRVVRWARLRQGDEAAQERHRADIAATEQALEALPGLAAERGTADEVAEQLRTEYDRRLRMLRAGDGKPDDGAAGWEEQYADLPGRDRPEARHRRPDARRQRDRRRGPAPTPGRPGRRSGPPRARSHEVFFERFRPPAPRTRCPAISADADQIGTLFEDTVHRRRLCGEGTFDLPGIIVALRTAGWHGPWGVEILSDEYRETPPGRRSRPRFGRPARCSGDPATKLARQGSCLQESAFLTHFRQ